MKKIILPAILLLSFSSVCFAQPLNQKKGFTHQDTLRGSVGPGRSWWDVTRYDLQVIPDYDAKSIKGVTSISFKVTEGGSGKKMQIDLQEPMIIDSIYIRHIAAKSATQYKAVPFTRDGNSFFADLSGIDFQKGTLSIAKIVYHGNPRIAKTPPWDGGWIFTKDNQKRPWMTVACQGLGASVWYPCKDYQGDEPDEGATLSMTVADSLAAVGNGRLKEKKSAGNGMTTWTWEVKNPINNYNIIPYIGKYVTWHEDYKGEKGNLDCDFWVLDYNLEKAKKQFVQVNDMLKCFEYWMGPYPFYEDGYKLVETPHLGMEHQSAVAYGNKYMNGYLGSDLSGTGYGKTWDYIIVHESGHEWFANNITTKDIADMWVHEGITDYSETLFVECQMGKDAGNAYTVGLRRSIRNDIPIIGIYGVNQEGSGDMYNKGNNLMHTIRQVIDNDELFRKIMRGMTETFYHKTVTSKDIEEYITKKSGKDLSKIWDQYLRTTKIPVLEYQFTQKDNNPDKYVLKYRWANTIDGFNMPVRVNFGGKLVWINPTTEFKTMDVATEDRNSQQVDIAVDKNFYVNVKKI